MTHEEVILHEPIRINSLYSLTSISDCYELHGYNIVNVNTGKTKTVNRMTTGKHYPYVTLNEKGSNKQIKVTLHKILALAYINNGPYELIEHLDDNVENYRIENLMFSNRYTNAKRAFVNGHPNRTDKIFVITLTDNTVHIGTIKELSKKLNIPRQTIYCIYYKGTPGKKVKSVILLTDQQTIEKIPAA